MLMSLSIASARPLAHTMAILAMQAGKHVYVEKPCGHDPDECEMLVRAQRKYGKLVQMGTSSDLLPHHRDHSEDPRWADWPCLTSQNAGTPIIAKFDRNRKSGSGSRLS